MRKNVRWIVGCGLLAAGLSAVSAWTEPGSPAALTTTAVMEQGLIVTAEGVFPKAVTIAENTPSSLWVVNGSGDPGTLSLQFPAPLVLELEKNKLTALNLAALKPGDYEIQFKTAKSGKTMTANLRVGNTANTATAQAVAIIAGYKQFKPEVTRFKGNQPVVVYWYTSSFIPHGDLELLGTEVKFKLKHKQMEIVELKQGLPAGVYLLSRPGYPKQNHGISARVVVE